MARLSLKNPDDEALIQKILSELGYVRQGEVTHRVRLSFAPGVVLETQRAEQQSAEASRYYPTIALTLDDSTKIQAVQDAMKQAGFVTLAIDLVAEIEFSEPLLAKAARIAAGLVRSAGVAGFAAATLSVCLYFVTLLYFWGR